MSSTIDKNELAQKIKALDGLTSDEKSALIGLLNTRKKYGLVWEEKQEDVEEQLREKLPVFTEVKERRIDARPQEKEAGKLDLFGDDEKDSAPPPDHIIIEGDNLHALTVLLYTHEGKIDVIDIDPPYNTGNKDFVYNDSYVDKEDAWRHSKWLCFMSKRLKLAKMLLKESGVIFIHIDETEASQLKLLCDEIFSEIKYRAFKRAVFDYEAEDGTLKLDVRLENETVWLTQKLMAELFQKDVRTINHHILAIFDEGELDPV